ncbi:MAG: purine-nucleoside phosphorylase [Spirochaetia bacterium]|jgi:purine-nucleoside phosphorylase|nr:purine-nucleoside phosphorylase [Spirochaetia bacterium]
MSPYSIDYYRKSADYILEKLPERPESALVLGSSLGSLAEAIQNPVEVEYRDIPNFLVSTVESHAGKFVFGTLAGRYVACMSGRFHYYEGYAFEELAAPMRVLKLLGVKRTILTNAAGAVNEDYSVGDIMLIRDHIKFASGSPMRGSNIPEFGPRFFDVTGMYSPALRSLALAQAEALGLKERVREGVYFYFGGPQFETPAEIRAAKILGADAVGMSTVTEALTAAHCGMDILGLSLITNMAAGVKPGRVSAEEVSAAAAEASGRLKSLIEALLRAL